MTDKSSAADALLTEPTVANDMPLKLEAAVTDPAATLDRAAQLDPAKVKQVKAKAPKRKRAPAVKRRTARIKAAIANDGKIVAADTKVIAALDHSDAARAEGKDAYEAAVAHEVDSFAQLPEGLSLDLRLADGGEFIDGVLAGVCQDIRPASQGVTYIKDVDIGPEGGPVRVTEAWLIASNGDAVRCAVGPLSGGNGFHARIPAGHLKF